MPDTGFKNTSTNPTIVSTGADWVNPNNAKGASDGVTASVYVTGTGASKRLRFACSGFNFGASGMLFAGMIVRVRSRGGFSV